MNGVDSDRTAIQYLKFFNTGLRLYNNYFYVPTTANEQLAFKFNLNSILENEKHLPLPKKFLFTFFANAPPSNAYKAYTHSFKTFAIFERVVVDD